VEEEYFSDREQWERVLKWLREQGPWALAAVAVVAAGYAGWHYLQSRQEQHYVSAASRYEALVEAFGSSNFDGGTKLADDLVREFPSSGYADQANLAVARYQVEHDELDKALARLQQVVKSTKDPELALVARLRVARVQLALGKADDALKTLDEVNPGAFAARFAQARGDILMSKGDRDGALKAYRAARDGGDTVDSGLLDLKIDELAHS
jgi:predicted negative regulator of RcsB-dependent stress response